MPKPVLTLITGVFGRSYRKSSSPGLVHLTVTDQAAVLSWSATWWTRPRTVSMSAEASTSYVMPYSAYRLISGEVWSSYTWKRAADDVLGVVGAVLDLGPPEQPVDEGFGVDPQYDGRVEPAGLSGEDLLQYAGLGERARVAVEDEPGAGVVRGEPLADHRVGDLVGDVLTGVEVALRGPAELGPFGDVGAENVTGGDDGHTEPSGEVTGMRSLAGPRRSHQDDSGHGNPLRSVSHSG